VTVKVWLPAATVALKLPLLQAAAAAESSWQLNVEPLLLDVNAKLAVVLLVGLAGLLVSVTVGGLVSTVHVWVAVPVLPAGSVAVTVKVWLPAATVALKLPLLQAAVAALSSLQSKVEFALLEVKAKLAVVLLVGLAGLFVSVTVGAVVSTVHVWVAVPVLPAGSVAVTVKVWLPAATVPLKLPLLQAAVAALSSLQSKLEFALLEVKAKLAAVELVGLAGFVVRVTVGAVVSTVQV
jgi:hypothetical protein